MNKKEIILVILFILFIILISPYTLTIPNTNIFFTPNEIKRLYPNSTIIIDIYPGLRIIITIILIGIVICIGILLIFSFRIKNKK